MLKLNITLMSILTIKGAASHCTLLLNQSNAVIKNEMKIMNHITKSVSK